MKVYVDELPKSCESCPFCQIETYVEFVGYTTNSYSCMLDGSMLTNTCPLQSLAEHDKQVRKQVCDEIKEQLGFIFEGKEQVVCDGSMTGDKTILAVLNKIQGE